MTDKVVVLVTCGSRGEARAIARSLVGKRLAACVNLLDTSVRSTYRWKGKVERAREFLLWIKTSRGKLRAAEREVKRMHRYDVPEFIALPIAAGSRGYLAWVEDCLRAPRAKGHKK
jgi:periplasmic divalent cation tolerance protein